MVNYKKHTEKAHYTIGIFISMVLLFIPISCISFYIPPDEYVPDKEVVYLKQRIEFSPIEYPAVIEEPYIWKANPVIDEINPDFLKITSFKTILKPDFTADATLYLEVTEHLQYIRNNKNYLSLKEKLNTYKFIKPEPRKISRGTLMKTYTNSREFEYPEIEGATILYFNDGDYRINLPDGSKYYYNHEGYYFENNAKGIEIYSVHPENESFRVFENGSIYYYWPDNKKIETIHGAVAYNIKGEFPEQYIYYPDTNEERNQYTFFINNNTPNSSTIAYLNKYGLRYDYFPESNSIRVSYKNEAIDIDPLYQKTHSHYNQTEHITEEPLSIYFPEGIRYLDLDKSISYSEVNPHWPENYKTIKIGPFIFCYTEKDKDMLSKLEKNKLQEIYKTAKDYTGLTCASWRTILLPPDLEAYRKLFVADKPEEFYWYPSGFQGKDIIVMWPPSVARYDLPEGEQYFWNQEFYEILIHEFVHLLVGETTGLIHQVPVWLNEGLAIYVESRYSQDVQKYWDTTFEVDYKRKILLRWDDITIHPTSYFPITKARTHYAQSYKMTEFLIKEYGIGMVVQYLKSFKGNDEKTEALLGNIYKENFESVFGISWEKNEGLFHSSINDEIEKMKDR